MSGAAQSSCASDQCTGTGEWLLVLGYVEKGTNEIVCKGVTSVIVCTVCRDTFTPEQTKLEGVEEMFLEAGIEIDVERTIWGFMHVNAV